MKSARANLSELKKKRAEVASGDRSELSAGAKATETTLNSFFKASGNDVIDKVDGALGSVQSFLADPPAQVIIIGRVNPKARAAEWCLDLHIAPMM